MKKETIRLPKYIIPNSMRNCLRNIKWKLKYAEVFKNLKKGIRTVQNRNHKIMKVVLVVSFPEMWNSLLPVYTALKANKNIETKVLAIPKNKNRTKGDRFDISEKNDAFLYFMSNGIDAINAYDNGIWWDLEKYEPDYVVYTRSYNAEYPIQYRSTVVCRYAKVCFIPYAYNMIDGDVFHITYNQEFVLSAYRVFCPNTSRFNDCRNYFDNVDTTVENKFQNLGYPRFDLLSKNCKIEAKMIKTILWIPRWLSGTSEENKKSHFLEYREKILDFAKDNPNLTLIIRPHPLMFSTLIEKNIMSEDEVAEYKRRCSEIGNVFFDTEKDYRESMNIADIVIADYSSLLVEYLIAGNIVIYCDDDTGLNNEGKIVTNSLYQSRSFDEITKLISKLVAGDDVMKSKREAAIKQLLPYEVGTISENIVNYIVDDYMANSISQ